MKPEEDRQGLVQDFEDASEASFPSSEERNRLRRVRFGFGDQHHEELAVNVNDDKEPGPSYSTNSETESSIIGRRMECLRGSKFAQLLGFGHGTTPDETFPVTMATLDSRDLWGHALPEVEAGTSNFPSGSLDSTFYQVGRRVVDSQWAMNYQEAAIFLEEGENNDMFTTHPKRRESLPAYILAHTKWFYVLDWLASMALLLLAIFERPPILEAPIGVHASLELGALTIITFGLILKMRWLGWRTTLRHQRTLLKGTILLFMFLETIIVLVRQQSHFRVTRALRPIFLVDNRYLRGVRRFSRQVLQSLPPIVDMLVLLLFFILMFSLLGHFLFGRDDDPFFMTAEDSFVNLFVLLTTANYPDIQMPSYYRSKWTVFFFVIYLVTVLYLFMNLLLAVVYDAFTTIEKEKFRKLIIHKQKASTYAFNLLVSKGNPDGVIFRHFHGMMSYVDSQKSLRDTYLSFRALNVSGSGILSREEFSKFYEVWNLRWKPCQSNPNQKPWTFFREFGLKLQNLLELPNANHFFNLLIVLNGVAMMIHCYEGSSQEAWDSYLFATLFLLEVILKIATWGPIKFFSSGWNVFDVLSSVTFFSTLLFARFLGPWDKFLNFVRPLRLLRLFKLKKRYRNIFGTVFILLPPMVSVAVVILLLYYFFAIIGMEVFSEVELKNCCKGTIFEDFYKDSGVNGSQVLLRYYLNSFDNVFSSFVTLFELTVVNNWYVIMEGHRIASGSRLSRLYFITFYLVTMCLLTVVIAFILDTFLFRMRYKREMDKKTEQKMLRREVALSTDEIDFCYSTRSGQPIRKAEILEDYGEDLSSKGYLTYVGWRRRNKEILLKRMFRDEIATWIRETDPSTTTRPSHSRATPQ